MAIAFDAPSGSFVNPGTSHTQAHTCTGTNRGLAVCIIGDGTVDAITGVTYASVAMTLVDKRHASGGRWLYGYYLENPASGSNNIVASASTSIYIEIDAASYSDTDQAQPEASATASNGSASALTTSVTTLTDNAWAILFALGQSGTITAGAGTTLRNSALVGAILDSNGPVTPAASKSLIHNHASTGFMEGIAISIAPASGGGGGGLAMPPRRAFPMSILNH